MRTRILMFFVAVICSVRVASATPPKCPFETFYDPKEGFVNAAELFGCVFPDWSDPDGYAPVERQDDPEIYLGRSILEFRFFDTKPKGLPYERYVARMIRLDVDLDIPIFKSRDKNYASRRFKPPKLEKWVFIGDDGKFNNPWRALKREDLAGEDKIGWSVFLGGAERNSGLNLAEKNSAEQMTGEPFDRGYEYVLVLGLIRGW